MAKTKRTKSVRRGAPARMRADPWCMTKTIRWKRRAVTVVRDFPPGCGSAWLKEQPRGTAKRALLQEDPVTDQGSDEEEPEEDAAEPPEVVE
ncbi:hypothetical protein L1987_65494 [Smallanthus sonchifolius]|uniref:Uncharacterized protein n=1 Tax=Smallanthus sonchifolius TaxID=185202 RepID=A0ACB9BUH2_9ASTR|nr:hypothetical protein L1987_65494 [Smallanthus sonchifolius]